MPRIEPHLIMHLRRGERASAGFTFGNLDKDQLLQRILARQKHCSAAFSFLSILGFKPVALAQRANYSGRCSKRRSGSTLLIDEIKQGNDAVTLATPFAHSCHSSRLAASPEVQLPKSVVPAFQIQIKRRSGLPGSEVGPGSGFVAASLLPSQ